MAGARDLILNGLMQSDLDAGGHQILNLDTSNLGFDADAFLVANNLSEGNAFIMRNNLGLGSLAEIDAGDIGRQLAELTFPNVDSYIKIEDGIALYKTPTELRTDIAAEPSLGNPAGNGYMLVSTMAGVRSWAIPGAGTPGSGTVTSVGIKEENGFAVIGSPITSAGEFELLLTDITPDSVNGIAFNTLALLPGDSSMQIDGAVFLGNFNAIADVTLSGTFTSGGDLFFADDFTAGGVVNFSSGFSVLGGSSLTLNVTGVTTLTLPLSGILATVAGTEPALGNPGTSGYILSSTTGGVRSWIPAGTGNPFSDAVPIIKGSADANKTLRISVSGFTAGAARVLTAPNYDGTIATLAGVETLTNKTLVSPVIGTGLVDTFAKFNEFKELVSAEAGTDYILISGTPTSGQVPIASSGTTAAWGTLSGSVSDTAFGVLWDAVTTVAPSKNAIYDWGLTLATLTGAETLTNKTLTAPILGVASATSVALTGTGGLGFVEFPSQSSPPSAPATGHREYADGTGRRAWIRASDGYRRTWDSATLTDDRVYGLPDLTGTVTLTTNKLSVFAATTSTEFRSVISDETGAGALVFANTPTLVTPELGTATANAITLNSDTAYGVGWNGSLAVPTQNAVYDKIEALILGSGSVATDAIFDAKGDLPVGTGSDTSAKLTVGANDTIAIADSTQTTGIRWGTPASVRTALALVVGTNVQAFSANLPLTGPGFTIDGGGSAITTGKVKGFFTCPYAATITGWNIVVDTGTVTIKCWKIATGTAKPTSANSINTSGIALSTGTAIHSTTLSDFTSTAVAANDIFAYNIEAVSGATEISFNLQLTKT